MSIKCIIIYSLNESLLAFRVEDISIGSFNHLERFIGTQTVLAYRRYWNINIFTYELVSKLFVFHIVLISSLLEFPLLVLVQVISFLDVRILIKILTIDYFFYCMGGVLH